jgi:FkbM family methyltransferase
VTLGGETRRTPLSRVRYVVWRAIRFVQGKFHQQILRGSLFAIPKSKPAVRQVLFKGTTLLVLANEDVGRQIYCLGKFESLDLDQLTRAIRADDICIDVGANSGVVSMLMAKAASSGQVHAFDPLPLNCALVQASACLSNVSVAINCCAVADKEGFTEFSESEDGAYSSIRPTGRRAQRLKREVPVTTLDSYAERQHLARVDVMKIDVEGAEELVLAGAASILAASNAPRVLMIELFDENLVAFGSSISSIVSLLGRYGYQPFIYESDGTAHAFEQRHHNRKINVFFAKAPRAVPSKAL